MQDLRFGRTLSVSSSGLLTIPRQADLVMLYHLVEKKGVGALEMLREFDCHV